MLTLDAQLLDAKMAEMSQEPEGWDENVRLPAKIDFHTLIAALSQPQPQDDIETAGVAARPELIKLKI